MFRLVAWSLLAMFLLLVGLWPAAATPVGLVFAGAGVVIAAIPGPALLIFAAVAWLRHRPARTPTA